MKKMYNIKPLILTLFLGVFQSVSFGQDLKLFSNGKEVKGLDCEMSNVKMEVKLPESVKDYDVVDIFLKRYKSKDYESITVDQAMNGIGFYRMRLAASAVNNLKAVFQLVNGEESDFVAGWNYFYNLKEVCNYYLRDFETTYNVVYIAGGTHSGYKWENEKKVKTYTWTTLKVYEFTQDNGAVNPRIYSKSNNISVDRSLTEKYEFNNTDDFEMLELTSLEVEESAGTFDFGTGQTSGRSGSLYAKLACFPTQSKEDVMRNIEKLLLQSTYYYFSYNIEPIFKTKEMEDIVVLDVLNGKNQSGSAGGESNSRFKGVSKKLTSMYGSGSGNTDKSKEMVENKMQNSADQFNWQTVQLDGVDFQYLELDYAEKQHFSLNTNKLPELKSGSQKNVKKFKIYVTEKDGKVYVFFAKQTGDESLSSELQNDYTSIFNTVKL